MLDSTTKRRIDTAREILAVPTKDRELISRYVKD